MGLEQRVRETLKKYLHEVITTALIARIHHDLLVVLHELELPNFVPVVWREGNEIKFRFKERPHGT